MSTQQSVKADERTIAVMLAANTWGLNFMTFALLIDIMYRSVVYHEQPWDLFALLILGGGISHRVSSTAQGTGTLVWLEDGGPPRLDGTCCRRCRIHSCQDQCHVSLSCCRSTGTRRCHAARHRRRTRPRHDHRSESQPGTPRPRRLFGLVAS